MENNIDNLLDDFAKWYKANGNILGGFRKNELPERFRENIDRLIEGGYVHKWNDPVRYVLNVEYRIPYDWNKLISEYITKKKKEGCTYLEIIEGLKMYLMEHHYLDGRNIPRNDEDREKCWKAREKNVEKLAREVPLSELKEYLFYYDNKSDIRKIKGLDLLITKLKNAKSIEEVDKILSYDFAEESEFDLDYINFLYGIEEKIVLSKIKNKKEIKKILKYMGRRFKKRSNNPFVLDLFSLSG